MSVETKNHGSTCSHFSAIFFGFKKCATVVGKCKYINRNESKRQP